jgi:preprotein translocase subunit SecF
MTDDLDESTATDVEPEMEMEPDEVSEAEPASAPAPRRSGKPARKQTGRNRLYHGETRIDFIGRQKIWFAVSALVILLGLVGGIARGGLNLGIDFRGGTSWEVPADVSVARTKTVMSDLGHPEARIQRFTPTAGSPFVRVSTKLEGSANDVAKRSTEIRDKLSTELAGGKTVDFSTVGPSWGGEITKKARNALIIFFLAIALYLSIRFEWRMAFGALAAVVHDILVTVGVYALVGFEVTPASVVAFLTILGYSLYDTVVVFDRIDENVKTMGATGRHTYSEIVNTSMNQVLMRSLNTSLVAILPIMSVLVIGSFVLGATSLEDFGLALFIGLLTGAYSSIFVATPVLAALKEREPRYAQIRTRLAQRGELGDVGARGAGTLRPGVRRPSPVTTPAPAVAGDARSVDTAPKAASGPRPTVQPRPRKKGKKR